MEPTSFCDVNNIGIVHNQPLHGNIKKNPTNNALFR